MEYVQVQTGRKPRNCVTYKCEVQEVTFDGCTDSPTA